MKSTFIKLFVIFALFSTSITAKNKTLEKMYFGGNIGASFGTVTQYSIHPYAAYKFTPQFSMGVKYIYEYLKDKRYTPSYETSNYGGSVFTRYRLFNPIYAHAEYQVLNCEVYTNNGTERTWVPFLFVGGGYSHKLGKNAWLNMQVLFDVLQDKNSPYEEWEPSFSIGVVFGF